MFVVLYVVNLIFMGNNARFIEGFKEVMKKEFEMSDLDLVKYFLGLEIVQGEEDIFVSQENYAKEVLMKFKMTICSLVSTLMEPSTKLSKYVDGDRVDAGKYRSLIRSLRYLTNTRPNLKLSVGITSWYMEELRYTHWKALKIIVRYVKE